MNSACSPDPSNRRIARELHDETSQAITSMIVGLRALEEAHPEVLPASSDLRQLAAGTLDEIHSLILELRPRALDELGLVPALSRYVADFGQKHTIRTEFQLIGPDHRLPNRVETCIYRVVQEAPTNVARHSGASTVGVVLDLRPPTVSAIVEDDGMGFDPEEVGSRSLGLVGGRHPADRDRPGLWHHDLRQSATEGGLRSALRTLLIDDHTVLRTGLRLMLQTQPDLEVVGEAADGSQGLLEIRRLKPDLVILDLSMPRVGGMEMLKQLLAE